MKQRISQEEYIKQIIERLKNEGYKIWDKIKQKTPDESFTFIGLAKKTKFESIRYGFYSAIFVFSRHPNPSISDLVKYSSVCYKLAKETTPFLPPRGMMYGFGCFPVVISDELVDETQVQIRQLDMPKHWAAFERLAVFNLADSQLYYSEKRPYWGHFYHELDITIINYLLGFTTQNSS